MGNLVVVNSERQRVIYNETAGKYPGKTVAPSFLRAETATQNGANSYSFVIQSQAQPNPTPTENLLNINDAFIATHIGLGLIKYDSTKPGNEQLQWFNCLQVFANEVGGFQNVDLGAIYNGKLSAIVDQYKYLDAYPANSFKKVYTTQDNGTTNVNEASWPNVLNELTPQFTFKYMCSTFDCLNIISFILS